MAHIAHTHEGCVPYFLSLPSGDVGADITAVALEPCAWVILKGDDREPWKFQTGGQISNVVEKKCIALDDNVVTGGGSVSIYPRPGPTSDEVCVFEVWLVAFRVLFYVCVVGPSTPAAMGDFGWRAGVGGRGGAHSDCAPNAAASRSRSGIAYLGVPVCTSTCNLLMLFRFFDTSSAGFLVTDAVGRATGTWHAQVHSITWRAQVPRAICCFAQGLLPF